MAAKKKATKKKATKKKATKKKATKTKATKTKATAKPVGDENPGFTLDKRFAERANAAIAAIEQDCQSTCAKCKPREEFLGKLAEIKTFIEKEVAF